MALTSSGAFKVGGGEAGAKGGEAGAGAGAGGGEAGARHVSLPVECFSSREGKVLLYNEQMVPFVWSEERGAGGMPRRRTSEEWRGVVQQVWRAIEWLGRNGVFQSDLGR